MARIREESGAIRIALPDGEAIIVQRVNDTYTSGSLWRIPAPIGEPSQVVHRERAYFETIKVSPDGREIGRGRGPRPNSTLPAYRSVASESAGDEERQKSNVCRRVWWSRRRTMTRRRFASRPRSPLILLRERPGGIEVLVGQILGYYLSVQEVIPWRTRCEPSPSSSPRSSMTR